MPAPTSRTTPVCAFQKRADNLNQPGKVQQILLAQVAHMQTRDLIKNIIHLADPGKAGAPARWVICFNFPRGRRMIRKPISAPPHGLRNGQAICYRLSG